MSNKAANSISKVLKKANDEDIPTIDLLEDDESLFQPTSPSYSPTSPSFNPSSPGSDYSMNDPIHLDSISPVIQLDEDVVEIIPQGLKPLEAPRKYTDLGINTIFKIVMQSIDCGKKLFSRASSLSQSFQKISYDVLFEKGPSSHLVLDKKTKANWQNLLDLFYEKSCKSALQRFAFLERLSIDPSKNGDRVNEIQQRVLFVRGLREFDSSFVLMLLSMFPKFSNPYVIRAALDKNHLSFNTKTQVDESFRLFIQSKRFDLTKVEVPKILFNYVATEDLSVDHQYNIFSLLDYAIVNNNTQAVKILLSDSTITWDFKQSAYKNVATFLDQHFRSRFFPCRSDSHSYMSYVTHFPDWFYTYKAVLSSGRIPVEDLYDDELIRHSIRYDRFEYALPMLKACWSAPKFLKHLPGFLNEVTFLFFDIEHRQEKIMEIMKILKNHSLRLKIADELFIRIISILYTSTGLNINYFGLNTSYSQLDVSTYRFNKRNSDLILEYFTKQSMNDFIFSQAHELKYILFGIDESKKVCGSLIWIFILNQFIDVVTNWPLFRMIVESILMPTIKNDEFDEISTKRCIEFFAKNASAIPDEERFWFYELKPVVLHTQRPVKSILVKRTNDVAFTDDTKKEDGIQKKLKKSNHKRKITTTHKRTRSKKSKKQLMSSSEDDEQDPLNQSLLQ